jgi:hypothetical protein
LLTDTDPLFHPFRNRPTAGTGIEGGGVLVRLAVSRLAQDTEEAVLDFDATDSLKSTATTTTAATCSSIASSARGPRPAWPVWAQLRTSNRDACDGIVEALEKIVPIFRERFPEVRIILRGDNGIAREAIFSWCEKNDMFHGTGAKRI